MRTLLVILFTLVLGLSLNAQRNELLETKSTLVNAVDSNSNQRSDFVLRSSIQLNAVSYHIRNNAKYNAQNFGLGLEYQMRRYRLTGGFYNNSYGRITFYAGAIVPLYYKNNFETGFSLGAGTGYEDRLDFMDSPIVVFGFGYVQYKCARVIISPVVLALQIVYPLH